MPAKKNGVITPSEARVIARDATAMRKTILALQVECGDRMDDRRFLILNESEAKRGYREVSKEEYERIRAIVRKLLEAYAARGSVTRAR